MNNKMVAVSIANPNRIWAAAKSAWRAHLGRKTDLIADDMHEFAKREASQNSPKMAFYYTRLEIASLQRRIKKCGEGEKKELTKSLYRAYCNAAALCFGQDTLKMAAKSANYAIFAINAAESAFDYSERREKISLLSEAVAKCCCFLGNGKMAEKYIAKALDIPSPASQALDDIRRHAILHYLAAEIFLGNGNECKAVENYNRAIAYLGRHQYDHRLFLREPLLWHILKHSEHAAENIGSYFERDGKKWKEYLKEQENYEETAIPWEPWMTGYRNKKTGEYTYSTPDFYSAWKQEPENSKEKNEILNQFPINAKW